MLSFRNINSLIAVACAGLIGTAYYMEYVLFLDPCPLCMVQRILVLLVGVLCFIAFIHNPKHRGQIRYAAGVLVVSILGAAAAGRHVWLQNLPSERIPECFPGIEFILANHPIMESLRIIFGGTGECAEIMWTLLGISIPGWTLIAFVAFCGTAIFLMQKARKAIRPM